MYKYHNIYVKYTDHYYILHNITTNVLVVVNYNTESNNDWNSWTECHVSSYYVLQSQYIINMSLNVYLDNMGCYTEEIPFDDQTVSVLVIPKRLVTITAYCTIYSDSHPSVPFALHLTFIDNNNRSMYNIYSRHIQFQNIQHTAFVTWTGYFRDEIKGVILQLFNPLNANISISTISMETGMFIR